MQKCDICLTEGNYRLRFMNSVWSCSKCLGRVSVPVESLGVVERVKVGSIWATKKQLGELERRKILPYKKPGGGYYVGRRMENGKISESRQPDYRP